MKLRYILWYLQGVYYCLSGRKAKGLRCKAAAINRIGNEISMELRGVYLCKE
jgi:hypothetical protein